MESSQDLAEIPRGNTCRGVNRAIIELLLSRGADLDRSAVLDIPCGRGEFLDTVRRFFPSASTTGADLQRPDNFAHDFFAFDGSSDRSVVGAQDYGLITCISGVMEFDNTLSFIRKLAGTLAADGTVIVTNDNLLTARDRILYLLFGRFRQYKLFGENDQPTWKVLTLQNLGRIISDAGLRVTEVRYVAGSRSDWLWLPLALPLYAAETLYFLFAEKNLPLERKTEIYPFISMIARHYLLVCERSPDRPPAEKEIRSAQA